MSATYTAPEDPDQPGLYEIRFKGYLDARWAARFEGMTLTPEDNGDTLLTGRVVDQAALHGLLRKVRDLGMPLLSITRVSPGASEGDKHMNTNRQTATIKESKMTITASKLIRWTGLAAMVAGIIFAGIQPIHLSDALSSVTTGAWAIITPLKTGMCFLFLLGITGIYARQVKEAGWLGLAGFLMLSLAWALELAFIFTEAFVLPPLAATSPQFVEAVLFGVITGRATAVNLGALPAIYAVLGILYVLGGLLFGLATLRAGILSRWAAGLLAVASTLTPLAALFPHEIQRLAGIPVGLAIAWLGYSLWSERRAQAAELVPGKASPQIRQAAAE